MKSFLKSKKAPVLILLFGILFLIVMVKIKKKPKKMKKEVVAPLVQVKSFRALDEIMKVVGSGTVKPSEIVNLLPQVQGQIVYKSKNMVDGGFVKKGEVLFKIDSREYNLRLASAKSVLAMQEMTYSREKEEVRIALHEWEEYKKKNNITKDASALTLREPQLKLAKANLDAAKAQVGLAELSLMRTNIIAPFTGRVKRKNVDVGQVVGPASNLATVYNTERVLISVPVKKEEAQWLKIPNSASRKIKRPHALIKADFGNQEFLWHGALIGNEAELDMRSRMVNLIVEIDKTYSNSSGLAMISGLFVDVEISGNLLKDVYKLPRNIIHNKNEVYIVESGKLKIKKVNILRTFGDYVVINSGILFEDKIIVSRLDIVLNNMKVRVK